MSNYFRPTAKVKIVPRDGEIEISININITFENNCQFLPGDILNLNIKEKAKENLPETPLDKKEFVIPDFTSGEKIDFSAFEGKKQS